MLLETKEDTSVMAFIEDLFEDYTFVNIVSEFPESNLTIPTIAVSIGKATIEQFELGNRDGRRIRQYHIDVFTSSMVQRNEFGYLILDSLKNGIVVYNYNEGFPPEVSPSVAEHLQVVSRHFIPVKIQPELVEKLYYRATVSFVATNDRT